MCVGLNGTCSTQPRCFPVLPLSKFLLTWQPVKTFLHFEINWIKMAFCWFLKQGQREGKKGFNLKMLWYNNLVTLQYLFWKTWLTMSLILGFFGDTTRKFCDDRKWVRGGEWLTGSWDLYRSWSTSSTVARDQAWVSQLKGQCWPFSLVSSGKPFHRDLRQHRMKQLIM